MVSLTLTLLAILIGLTASEEANQVDLQLDHIYICVANEAPEAKILQEAGLQLASDTAYYTDQGTVSVFYYFENVYLELIWVEDSSELEKTDQQLATKFKNVTNGGSPFGLGLRGCDPSTDSLPFETKSSFAEGMEPGSSMEIVDIELVSEPEIFVVSPDMGWDRFLDRARSKRSELLDELKHPAGIEKLNKIRITGPDLPTKSEAIVVLSEQGLVNFDKSDKHVIELTFDEGRRGKTIDARPVLPLLIHY